MSKSIGTGAAATRGTAQQDTPDQLVDLGRVVSAYGVMGWIKLQPYSSTAETLQDTAQWWLTRPAPTVGQGAVAPPALYTVLDVRPQGATVVARLAGINDRDAAEALRGMSVSVPRAAFAKAQDDEYYWVDLIGCAFYGEDQGQPVLLGEVAEVLDNSAHGVLRILLTRPGPDGSSREPVLDAKGRPAETLVPFVRAHVHTVDLAARRIDSDWPIEI
jgi:16S rRNA processing protein RimM